LYDKNFVFARGLMLPLCYPLQHLKDEKAEKGRKNKKEILYFPAGHLTLP
jgi:hypothetical protein